MTFQLHESRGIALISLRCICAIHQTSLSPFDQVDTVSFSDGLPPPRDSSSSSSGLFDLEHPLASFKSHVFFGLPSPRDSPGSSSGPLGHPSPFFRPQGLIGSPESFTDTRAHKDEEDRSPATFFAVPRRRRSTTRSKRGHFRAGHLKRPFNVFPFIGVGVLSNMRKFFTDLRTNLDPEKEIIASSSREALELPPRSGPAASASDALDPATAAAAAAVLPHSSSRLSTASLLSAFLPELEGPATSQDVLTEDMNADQLLALFNRQVLPTNDLSSHSPGWSSPIPHFRFGSKHGQPYAHSGLGK
ncbi:uncharacterized protein LOC143036285 [Oratosquilla oratoria]|uniref:uncharacterized protein LOC143036285 n=1 Tax=Oratosquilla oratoria TaxID=337810 RepID=UPI003F76685B